MVLELLYHSPGEGWGFPSTQKPGEEPPRAQGPDMSESTLTLPTPLLYSKIWLVKFKGILLGEVS